MFSALNNFRQRLYARISKRRAAALDLIDAVSSHHGLGSITALSLSPFFRRKYNSITKAIADFALSDTPCAKGAERMCPVMSQKTLFQLTGSLCPEPVRRDFFCLAPM
jgi:hypothetical protein